MQRREGRDDSRPARGGAYEATLSGDGRRVTYTAFVGSRLQVFVRDLSSGRTVLASRLPSGRRATEAWEPSLSRDGRRVAFTATGGQSHRARVYVRDLLTRARAVAVSGPRAGYAAEPSLSADGGRVAYAEQPHGARPSALGRPGQRIVVRDVGAGRAHVASIGAAGAALRGWSAQPALSGDGRRVAFTTGGATDPRGGPGGLRVLVRDLQVRTMSTANPPAPPGVLRRQSLRTAAHGGAAVRLAPPAW